MVSAVRFAPRIASTVYGFGGGGGAGGGVTSTARSTTTFGRGAAGRAAAICTGSPNRFADFVPTWLVGAMSSGLRRASMIWPSAEASTTRLASSGVSSKVTTDEGMGSPFDLSWSYRVPAVSTCTLLTTTRVASASVTKTSTLVPGTTKPATPTTSFTRTEIARMPSGIVI